MNMSAQEFETAIPESALAAVGAKSADEFFARVIQQAIEASAKAQASQERIAKIGAEIQFLAPKIAESQRQLEHLSAEINRIQAIVEARTMTPETIARIQQIAGESADLRLMRSIPSYLPAEETENL